MFIVPVNLRIRANRLGMIARYFEGNYNDGRLNLLCLRKGTLYSFNYVLHL